MRNHPKIAELSKLVNEKARELQNVQESVDMAKLDIRQLGERKTKLNKEIDLINQQINDKQIHLESVIKKEESFLSSIKKEVIDESQKLLSISEKLSETSDRLSEAEKRIGEFQNYANKINETRKAWLEKKNLLSRIEVEIKQFLDQSSVVKEEVAREKKELGEYKNYLTDFYGKVATYVITAQDILAYVNQALEENVPLRFEPPSKPITMDNFNK